MNHLATSTAALLIGGGSYAYLKAGSLPSLAGSFATACVFLGSNYILTQTDHTFYGCVVGAVGGAAVFGSGCMRFGKSKTRFVPITLLSLGLINLVYYGIKSVQWKQTVVVSNKE